MKTLIVFQIILIFFYSRFDNNLNDLTFSNKAMTLTQSQPQGTWPRWPEGENLERM